MSWGATDEELARCNLVRVYAWDTQGNRDAIGTSDLGAVKEVLEKEKGLGATFCFPHQCVTDALVDRRTRTIRHMDALCGLMRERAVAGSGGFLGGFP